MEQVLVSLAAWGGLNTARAGTAYAGTADRGEGIGLHTRTEQEHLMESSE